MSTAKRGPRVDLSLAGNYIIASNHDADPRYAPYCGRCPGLWRMSIVEPFLWRHSCGAVHDERQVIISNEGKADEHTEET